MAQLKHEGRRIDVVTMKNGKCAADRSREIQWLLLLCPLETRCGRAKGALQPIVFAKIKKRGESEEALN